MEVGLDATRVGVEQHLHLLKAVRSDDQPDVMLALHPPDDLGIVIRRSIRLLLAGQRDQQARVHTCVGGRLVIPGLAGDLDLGPFGP